MSHKEEMLLKAFNKVMSTKLETLEIDRASLPEWDSMKHAELIIQLQNTFKIRFKIADVLEINSLKDFLPLL